MNTGKQMARSDTISDGEMSLLGAPVRPNEEWLQANWSQISAEVNRLQVRIAKATQANRWGKVQALQRLLSRSFNGKMLAVKRVTENSGKNTPGVDGRIWASPTAKLKGAQSLRHHGYRPMPLRRIYIPKSNSKKLRPLGIPTIRCRAFQALWKLALEPVAETLGDPNSYGFRPKRSTADAIEQCFTCLSRGWSPQWVLEGDIKGCFDNISHDWLLSNTPMDKVILGKWLKAGFIEAGKLFKTTAGTPQGGIISPVLANWTLDGLEAAAYASIGRGKRTSSQRAKVHVIRYADDFVVTGISKEILQTQVRPAIETFLAERGLELSPTKTSITHVEEGFDFLGQNIRKYDGKLLIKPAKKSINSLLEKVHELLKRHAASPQQLVIMSLNRVIWGWAMYHRHVVSKECFAGVDARIWRMLWRWAQKRHPNKAQGWILRRYFHRVGRKTWGFVTKIETNAGPTYWQLFQASSVSIRRHVKINSSANPFDPQWDTYLEKREHAKVFR